MKYVKFYFCKNNTHINCGDFKVNQYYLLDILYLYTGLKHNLLIQQTVMDKTWTKPVTAFCLQRQMLTVLQKALKLFWNLVCLILCSIRLTVIPRTVTCVFACVLRTAICQIINLSHIFLIFVYPFKFLFLPHTPEQSWSLAEISVGVLLAVAPAIHLVSLPSCWLATSYRGNLLKKIQHCLG